MVFESTQRLSLTFLELIFVGVTAREDTGATEILLRAFIGVECSTGSAGEGKLPKTDCVMR